jgi:hypothetical protein
LRTPVLPIVLAFTGCAAPDPQHPRPDPHAPVTLSIVDEAGAPVAGARITWTDGGGDCDVTRPFPAAYVWSGSSIADVEGRATIDRPGRHLVRVVAPDGEAASLFRIDTERPPASVVLHRTATVVVAPTCAGAACQRVRVNGKLTSASAVCTVSASSATGPVSFVNLPRGDLEVTLDAAEDRDDQAHGVLHQAIVGNVTLAPRLATVGGPEVVRGRVLMPGGAPPGGPSYATSVEVTCGPGLFRHVDVDTSTGAFAVMHLPARACTLRARSDGAHRWERTIDITPGRTGEVIVELERDDG